MNKVILKSLAYIWAFAKDLCHEMDVPGTTDVFDSHGDWTAWAEQIHIPYDYILCRTHDDHVRSDMIISMN